MSSPSLDSLLETENYLESLSDDSDLEIIEPTKKLLQRLTVKHLEDLENFFKDELDNFADLKLNKNEFVYAIDSVLGNSKYSVHAVALYNDLPYEEEEKITWKQFLDYIFVHICPEKSNFSLPNPQILPLPHVEKETIVKIVPIETKQSFCYAILSKFGKIGLYSGDLRLLQNYQIIFTRSDKTLMMKRRKINTIWILDAIFMPKVNILIVSTSGRSLIFYDASGQKHVALWLIEGIKNEIYSLASQCDDSGFKIFLGNNRGMITKMTFFQPKEGLLRKKYNDKMSHYYWSELVNEKEYVHIEYFKNIHFNTVLSIIYYPEINSIVSCSQDKRNSIVFFNLKEHKKIYVFGSDQGANCFSLNHKLHILLSGDNNGILQFWNIYVPSKAIATIHAHKFGIVDVKIFAFKQFALSCSRDGVLKVWNLDNFKCDQIITLKYPCFDILGKLIEWGTSSIYPGPNRSKNLDVWERSPILITCCNYIAKINTDDVSDDFLPPPPLQNEIIIPYDWKIEDHDSISLETNNMEDEEIKINENHSFLKTIINRDFFKNHPSLKHDINLKIAQVELKKMEMQKPVSLCAPFLALDLYEVEEIKLPQNLPVPHSKKIQKLVDRTHRMLSAASNRSEILSDRSSKSKSSRSSVVEF